MEPPDFSGCQPFFMTCLIPDISISLAETVCRCNSGKCCGYQREEASSPAQGAPRSGHGDRAGWAVWSLVRPWWGGAERGGVKFQLSSFNTEQPTAGDVGQERSRSPFTSTDADFGEDCTMPAGPKAIQRRIARGHLVFGFHALRRATLGARSMPVEAPGTRAQPRQAHAK